MHILGINAYHGGASACIVRDGQLVAAVEDERFRRLKYWAGFPTESIKFCLQQAGITAHELDHVAISRDPKAHLSQKVLFTLRKRPSFGAIRDRVQNMGAVKDVKSTLCAELGINAEDLKAEFHRVEHHRAHMASAFFVSPFEDAAILSIDGMGDFVSTMVGSGKENQIDVDDQVLFPHSLGIFFTALTQWLGFPNYGDEGKVQGLAPYGEPKYLEEMHKMVRLLPNGHFELDLKYFVHHAQGVEMSWDDGSPTIGTLYSPEVVKLLGEPRPYRGEYTQHHYDVAASMQAMLEEAEFHIVRDAAKRTGKKALCLAGGVALNSSFNGKILPETDFEDIYIQPAAGDAGTAIGAAYYVLHQVLGKPRTFEMTHSYTGPSFSNAQIEARLKERNLEFRTLDGDALFAATADRMLAGDVVGWFQGAAEWGPRALGNRSIVADPRRADMKEILNARIKHREAFRPFAPSVLGSACGEYFEQSYPDPFMLKVYKVREAKRSEIPAVTHVDGTGRVQTVEREVNERYHDLIRTFGEKSGTPVVLNTSFNDNEPIVCTPDEAINCFERTHMDTIVLGNYMVQKS